MSVQRQIRACYTTNHRNSRSGVSQLQSNSIACSASGIPTPRTKRRLRDMSVCSWYDVCILTASKGSSWIISKVMFGRLNTIPCFTGFSIVRRTVSVQVRLVCLCSCIQVASPVNVTAEQLTVHAASDPHQRALPSKLHARCTYAFDGLVRIKSESSQHFDIDNARCRFAYPLRRRSP